MTIFSRLFALLGAAACLWGGVAQASDAKTLLIRDAVVNGQSIYLSDLLPDSSPSAVRTTAQEILVGRSPQPGSLRVLSSNDIVRLLRDGDLLNRVEVPDQIVIHRLGHVITRDEVAKAIRKTLGQNQAFANLQFAPEDLRFAARMTVSADDADLHVTRMELDPSLHEMKFWLASGAEPALLPFLAMAHAACNPCGSAQAVQPIATQNLPQPSREIKTSMNALPVRHDVNSLGPAFSGPALVEAGKSAQLHLVSGGEMQMYLNAVSLERGMFGQIVRVRIQSTGKILNAHVVGRNQVEAKL